MKNILKKYIDSRYSLLLTGFSFITLHFLTQSCLLSDCSFERLLRPIYFHFIQPVGIYFLYGILGYVTVVLLFKKFPKKFAFLWTTISIFLVLITDTESYSFFQILIKNHVALWLGSLFTISTFIVAAFLLLFRKSPNSKKREHRS